MTNDEEMEGQFAQEIQHAIHESSRHDIGPGSASNLDLLSNQIEASNLELPEIGETAHEDSEAQFALKADDAEIFDA